MRPDGLNSAVNERPKPLHLLVNGIGGFDLHPTIRVPNALRNELLQLALQIFRFVFIPKHRQNYEQIVINLKNKINTKPLRTKLFQYLDIFDKKWKSNFEALKKTPDSRRKTKSTEGDDCTRRISKISKEKKNLGSKIKSILHTIVEMKCDHPYCTPLCSSGVSLGVL